MPSVLITTNLPVKLAQEQLQQELTAAVGPNIGVVAAWQNSQLFSLTCEWADGLGYDPAKIKQTVKNHKPSKSDQEKVDEENAKGTLKERIEALEARVTALEGKSK